MSNKDYNDGFFRRWTNNSYTYDHLAGRIAHDKLFNTNSSGWNPPKPKPTSTGIFGLPKPKGRIF